MSSVTTVVSVAASSMTPSACVSWEPRMLELVSPLTPTFCRVPAAPACWRKEKKRSG
jgi:hypothetical protein